MHTAQRMTGTTLEADLNTQPHTACAPCTVRLSVESGVALLRPPVPRLAQPGWMPVNSRTTVRGTSVGPHDAAVQLRQASVQCQSHSLMLNFRHALHAALRTGQYVQHVAQLLYKSCHPARSQRASLCNAHSMAHIVSYHKYFYSFVHWPPAQLPSGKTGSSSHSHSQATVVLALAQPHLSMSLQLPMLAVPLNGTGHSLQHCAKGCCG